jgi:hypothetical protein
MARWPYGKVTIEVPCDDEIHRVAIDKGELKLLDHPGGVKEMMDAFVVFGADPPTGGCLGFAQKWAKDPLNLAASLGPWPDDATHVYCPECGWEGDFDAVNLGDFSDIYDEIEPGRLTPAGLCPRCFSHALLAFGSWKPE